MTLYNQILKATDGLDGWCDKGKRITLANLVIAMRPRCIVEIGVWGGQSLIPMAMAAQYITNVALRPRVIAIDPWQASESVKGQEEKDAKWWGEEVGQPQHDAVYGRFLLKLMELGLKSTVEVQRQTSAQYLLTHPIDIFHCDANHGPQALEDVKKFGPAITQSGVVILDDLNWTGGNVGKAAEWLKENGFLELHPLGTGAVYIKL